MAYTERNRRRVRQIVVKDATGLDQWNVPGTRAVEQQPGSSMENARTAGAAGEAVATQWGGRPEPNRARR